MPLIETDVSIPAIAPEGLPGFALDLPRVGQRVGGDVLEIEGWVARQGGVAAIEVLQDGEPIRRVVPNVARPDLRRVFPELSASEACGFRTSVAVSEWRRYQFSLRAVLGSQALISVAEITARRVWRESASLDDTPLVSIVILRNASSQFPTESIESVLAQSYPHLEVVLVGDNFAPPGEGIASRDATVRIVKPDSKGPSGARNAGIRHTLGDFLMFLKPTDRLLPDALRLGLETFREHPESAAVFGHRSFLGSTGTASPETCRGVGENASDLLPLYRRSLFESVGVFQKRTARPDQEMVRRTVKSFPFVCHHHAIAEGSQRERPWPIRASRKWGSGGAR